MRSFEDENAVSAVESRQNRRAFAGRTTRTTASAPLFGGVLIALVGLLPSTARPSLTLRFAVVVIAVAVGLPICVGLARRRDRAAMLALAFVLWSALSTLGSGEPWSWFGSFFSMTGAVFVAACASAWAVGRGVPVRAVPALRAAVVVGAVVNAAVAVLQTNVDLSPFDVALYDERATGLLGNPVFLGALCAAAIALLPDLLERRVALGVLAAAVLAAGVQVSGTRNALLVMGVVTLWGVFQLRARLALLLVAAVIGGVLAGGAMELPQGSTAVARLGAGGGLSPRMENWREGLSAMAEKPILGHGTGRYGPAVSPHRTPEIARLGADRLYVDAHNIAVEYGVTTGVVGLALVAAWGATIAWRVRTHLRLDLVVAALALLAFHVVEPQHLVLTPLLLLLLGATDPSPRAGAGGTALRTGQAVLAVGAVALAGTVVVGDLAYRDGELDFDLAKAKQSSALLSTYARPVSLETRIHLYRARTEKDPRERVIALATARRALAREPGDFIRHVAVASILEELGRPEEALRAYAEALERNPWSTQALVGRAQVFEAADQRDAAAACRAAARVETRDGSGLRRSRLHCLEAELPRG